MKVGVLLAMLFIAPSAAQPDLGPLSRPVDELIHEALPPVIDAGSTLLGQNLSREDVRLYAHLEFREPALDWKGMVFGSGKAVVEADVQLRAEMRVISTERLRALLEGDNAYNLSADGASWTNQLYLPAEAFRLTAMAQIIAAFQEQQERSLRGLVERSMPELDVVRLQVDWDNVHPTDGASDLSLTDPPIVATVDATLRYERTESLASLIDLYIHGRNTADDPRRQYIQDLKEENGKALTARDFFAAAAYTQLLNLSMQPGWSLQVRIEVPDGYSFEYSNQAVDVMSEQVAQFELHGDGATEEQEVYLLSITHRRGVATLLLSALLILGGLVVLPTRWLYGHFRVRQPGGDGKSR